MTTTTDTFQIVIAPVSPGTCRTCGINFPQRRLVETGLDAEFCIREHVNGDTVDYGETGAVYFCELCVMAMADAFGGISPEKAEELKREIAYLINKNKELEIKNLGLERIVDGYSIMGTVNSSTITDSNFREIDLFSQDDESTDSTRPTGEHLSSDGEHGITSGSSETDKSSSSESTDGLSTDSGIESGGKRDESSSTTESKDLFGF